MNTDTRADLMGITSNRAEKGLPALAGMSRGMRAALLVLLVGAICLLLQPQLVWLQKFPEALTLPATAWIGTGVTWLVDLARPAARWGAWALSHPMAWANFLLIQVPYPLVIASIVALGWYLGGLTLAGGALAGLLFVLFSGYWMPGMTTLSLVIVSVPLALLAGLVIGILAYKMPILRRPIQALLDIMQTVPTFAYLTPLLLLLGFGPVVGLIASAIYAAPPMARNVLLGLERVEPEIREAALMSGANSWQQLLLVELPAASRQLLIGLNQCIMAALSMVIIAAVIGGFDDIGWAVLLTMRKADFGNSLIAGMVIVTFAIMIDRLSRKFIDADTRHSARISFAVILIGAALAAMSILTSSRLAEVNLLAPIADWLNTVLGLFTADYATLLKAIKTKAMIYLLLPLRIGLDHAILPATWGFPWGPGPALAYSTGVAGLAGYLAWRGRSVSALIVLIAAGVLKVGITHLAWPFVLVIAATLGWVASGWGLALFSAGMLGLIMIMGLWEAALLSIYLSGTAVLICALVGGLIGLAAAANRHVWGIVRPICDFLQTIPLFVFLIPVLMFFQIGEFSALLAICAYAIVPMIRYTHEGLTATPEELIEAATASGATEWAIMREVRAPYAAPTILLGINQTILYAFSMLVIAALIGTTDLGQTIYLALGQGDVGLGVAAGTAMAILALVADRLLQGFALERRKALGL